MVKAPLTLGQQRAIHGLEIRSLVKPWRGAKVSTHQAGAGPGAAGKGRPCSLSTNTFILCKDLQGLVKSGCILEIKLIILQFYVTVSGDTPGLILPPNI